MLKWLFESFVYILRRSLFLRTENILARNTDCKLILHGKSHNTDSVINLPSSESKESNLKFINCWCHINHRRTFCEVGESLSVTPSWIQKGNSPIYKYCFTEQWAYKLTFAVDPGITEHQEQLLLRTAHN